MGNSLNTSWSHNDESRGIIALQVTAAAEIYLLEIDEDNKINKPTIRSELSRIALEAQSNSCLIKPGFL